MANAELVEFIRTSLEKGRTHSVIQRDLKNAGWPVSEINAAFMEIQGEKIPPVPHNVPYQGRMQTRPNEISGGSGTGYHRRFFQLQQGEKIVFESKPLKGLLWFMFISSIIVVFVISLFLGPFAGIVFLAFGLSDFTGFGGFVSGIAIMFLILLIIDILTVRRRYNMRYYWITNQRIITKQGFIGYSVNSIPLERISDVIISRSFLERTFGFGSLFIQSLAGQYTQGGKRGSEGNLQAVPNPEDTQALIFNLVKQRRKEANLTM